MDGKRTDEVVYQMYARWGPNAKGDRNSKIYYTQSPSKFKLSKS